MTNPPLQKRNSFVKAMVLTVIVVIPIVVVSAMGGKDANAAGEFAGWLSTGPILGGIAVGIWARFDKRQWNWLDYIWRFAVCSVAIFFVSTVGQAGRWAPKMADVTETEKQHLLISGAEARHSDFGFTVPLPTPAYRVSSELQEQANQWFVQRGLKSSYVWALQDPAESGVIMVLVTKGIGDDQAAMRGLGRGFQRGAGQEGARIIEDTLQWSPGAHEYRFATFLPQGVFAKARCLPSSAFIVCVQTVSADSNGLDAARAGVRLASWK
jgi:hypothetical protein